MTYWILILIAIIILLFVWRTKDYEEVVSQISLVGSVSSILLALIAIGYAFFQSNSAEWESRKMIELLKKMEEKIGELDTVKDDLISIKDNVREFKQSSQSQLDLINDSINKLPDVIDTKPLSEYMKNQGIQMSQETEEGLKKLYKEEIEVNFKDLKSSINSVQSRFEKMIIKHIYYNYEPYELIRFGEIKDEFNLTNSILSKIFKSLEDKGFVVIRLSNSNPISGRANYFATDKLFDNYIDDKTPE